MMTAQQPAEAVLLVTEPTPFGLHDFRLAVEALKPLNKPMGVIINRAGLGYEKVHEFCQNEGLEVLASIEYDEKIAQAYSRGERLIQAAPHVAEKLLNAHSRLEQLVRERKEEGQA
jgi:MinD superfamily P-loop ATPase